MDKGNGYKKRAHPGFWVRPFAIIDNISIAHIKANITSLFPCFYP